MADNQSAKAGQAVYTKSSLSLYDIWVLGVSNTFLWKCPTKHLRKEFSTHATDNHLDVGVGTGYYLDKCLSNIKRRVALLDMNKNSLQSASTRINRFNPEIYCRNVLEPIELNGKPFDSISVNYLLHCMPGNISEKSIMFRYLEPLLNENGTLFGSTILGQGSNPGFLARQLMSFYNKKGIFDNTDDDLIGLQAALDKYFQEVKIVKQGCVAIFSAKKLPRDQ